MSPQESRSGGRPSTGTSPRLAWCVAASPTKGRPSITVSCSAEQLTVIDGRPFVGDAATHHARRGEVPVDGRPPDLLSCGDIDSHGIFGVGDVHHVVVDKRLSLFAVVAAHG